MTPYEKYKKAVASRPSNEDIKYWASLDTKAAEIQKEAFNADLEERSEQFNKWLVEYDSKKVVKSNGTSLEDWAIDFREHVGMMSGLDRDAVPMNYIEEHYHNDEQSGIAALHYVEFYEPDEPDPEMVAQQEQMKVWMATLTKADEIHKARLEGVRWLPEEEAKKKWNERQYAK